MPFMPFGIGLLYPQTATISFVSDFNQPTLVNDGSIV